MAIYLRPAVRAELRRRYAKLKAIPGHRWSTAAGQAFLHELHEAAARYGRAQLAESLEVSPQGVSAMLKRYDPTQITATLRTEQSLAELAVAYSGVQKWRALNRVVQRHHRSWHLMNDAIETLAVLYPIPVIARLSGIRAQELHRFMTPADTTTSYDNVAMLLLMEEYDGGRALSSPRRRAFLTLLEETLASHSVAEVALILRVKPALVRGWMVEKTHGQRPAEQASPGAGRRRGDPAGS